MTDLRTLSMATFLEEYGEVFDLYDDLMTGEIKCKTLHTLYSKVRPPGIRLAQVNKCLLMSVLKYFFS